ncbi:hypothetical protein [Ralstonia pseudosolanacearum]|uniref:hypothetical protein n=1 Tax=Ralstonia pseudosolanacearum TaxID=1310165 RepID=UPI003D047BBD
MSYMAQGKWYDLRDQGDGAIRGSDSSFGAGTLDYVTGSVILTTGALPDANTAILFAWGSAASYFNRVACAGRRRPPCTTPWQHPGIAPGTLAHHVDRRRAPARGHRRRARRHHREMGPAPCAMRAASWSSGPPCCRPVARN